MYGAALSITEDLDLNVMTIRVVSFDEQARILEKVLSTRLDHCEGALDLFDALANRKSHTSSTRCSLQHYREPQFLAFFNSIFFARDQPLRAWYYPYSGLRGKFPCSMLDTERLDALGAWTYPHHASGRNAASKVCILR